jgi:hypothetical protein
VREFKALGLLSVATSAEPWRVKRTSPSGEVFVGVPDIRLDPRAARHTTTGRERRMSSMK